MSPMQTILDFIVAWNDNDMDRVHEFMAEDIFYHNVPMEPIMGRAAAREFADAFGVGSKMMADLKVIGSMSNHNSSSMSSFIEAWPNRASW
jgi:limonene-1,2-epoxide hydrolase